MPGPWRLGPRENLLAPTLIRLFGVEFDGLKVNLGQFEPPKNPKPECMSETATASAPVVDTVVAHQGRGEARLARIYAYAYEGHYYRLTRPCIFLVHGEGVEIQPLSGVTVKLHGTTKGDDEFCNSIADLGAEIQQHLFSCCVRMWAYDRLDYAVRVDLTMGFFSEVLLDPAQGPGTRGADGPAVGRDGPFAGRAEPLSVNVNTARVWR